MISIEILDKVALTLESSNILDYQKIDDNSFVMILKPGVSDKPVLVFDSTGHIIERHDDLRAILGIGQLMN